jgi:hypothetical protein
MPKSLLRGSCRLSSKIIIDIHELVNLLRWQVHCSEMTLAKHALVLGRLPQQGIRRNTAPQAVPVEYRLRVCI